MDYSNLIVLMEQRLDLLKYLEYETLNPANPREALSAKTTLTQTNNFLRASFGDQSPYYQNFNKLAFYYGAGKRDQFEQNKEIAIGILENALAELQRSNI